MQSAIVIWGIPKGETERYMECLLADSCKTSDDVEKVKRAAAYDGFHSFRVSRVRLDIAPNFAATVNI